MVLHSRGTRREETRVWKWLLRPFYKNWGWGQEQEMWANWNDPPGDTWEVVLLNSLSLLYFQGLNVLGKCFSGVHVCKKCMPNLLRCSVSYLQLGEASNSAFMISLHARLILMDFMVHMLHTKVTSLQVLRYSSRSWILASFGLWWHHYLS